MSKSDGLEHLASVHDNPFMREFGIETVLSNRDAKRRGERKASVDSLSTVDNESEQEYHVNSGFVNKLRSKFNQLQNESSHKVTLSRKSASLENLLGSDSSNSSSYGYKSKGHQQGLTHDDSHATRKAGVELRKKTTPGLKLSNRPRSNEEGSITSDKPQAWRKKDRDVSAQNNFKRDAFKPPIPKKKTSDTASVRQPRNSASDTTKHKLEHHDWKVAPDLEKLGRDNIVIIESSSPSVRRKSDTPPEQPVVNAEKLDKNEDLFQVRPARDKPTDENELPKPNTVSAFRSLFENTKKASDVIHSWRNQSPIRTSAGSESPSVSSPIASPRSPLVRMNDENVFKASFKSVENTEKEKTYSPRLSNPDTSSMTPSPRNSSSEIAENIDTTSTSMQKSLEVFQSSQNDQQQNVSLPFVSNKSGPVEPEDKPSSPTPLSPRLATDVPQEHPLSNIFDSSKLVKKDKPKKPKPTVIARKPHPVPKDTIELKHEADKKRLSAELNQQQDKKPDKSNFEGSLTFNQQSDDASSGRNSGKISPRKTEIFDSSKIVKKDRPTPKFVSSPTEKQFKSSPVRDEPAQVTVEVKTREEPQTEQKKDISDIQTGVEAVTNNIVKNDLALNIEQKKTKFKAPMIPHEGEKSERAKHRAKPADNKSTPVSGMSSYLANKLKNQKESNGTASALTNGSLPSPVPRKRQAPDIPAINGSAKPPEPKTESPPPLPATQEPDLPKTDIDDIMKRKKKSAMTSTKMVFDSSNIVKKKKETPKRKPPKKTIEELNRNVMSEPTVPLLDLSSLTNDKPETEYQEGYIPTEIKPCPFLFVGAEVTFKSSPYKKRKKNGVRLAFDEKAPTTYEYEAEETALENYLQEHPEERDEALKQEMEESGASASSTANLMNDTPMAPEPEPASMKSNTVIGMSTGALTNYKSKMQVQDFQFGVSQEPEFFSLSDVTNDETNEDNMQLLPADDNELDTFSAETGKADLLF